MRGGKNAGRSDSLKASAHRRGHGRAVCHGVQHNESHAEHHRCLVGVLVGVGDALVALHAWLSCGLPIRKNRPLPGHSSSD